MESESEAVQRILDLLPLFEGGEVMVESEWMEESMGMSTGEAVGVF